jgi:hypothetical protein
VQSYKGLGILNFCIHADDTFSMTNKYLYTTVCLALLGVFLLAYPSMQNIQNKNAPDDFFRQDFIESSGTTSENSSDASPSGVSAETQAGKPLLTGMNEKELHQLRLLDNEDFFRESYRRKVLAEDEKFPVYYTKEARKRAAQHKLNERLLVHLNKEDS